MRDPGGGGNALVSSRGIEVGSDSLVLRNKCEVFSGSISINYGIRVTGSGNRIDGNSVRAGTTLTGGISVTAAGNLIVRNSVAGGFAPYSIAGMNTDAFVVTPGADFAVLDAWANTIH